jgi:hypothetical protein
MTVLTSSIALSLKETLEEIITDDPGGAQKRVMFKKWCKEQSMSDAYEDDVEYAGPGYASEVAEASPIPLGSITEGAVTRYIARKFGLKLAVSEEAVEDGKYSSVIDAAKRLAYSLWDTADLDATLMLVRATTSGYVYGDGVTLASSSHTLPGGGTFSNTLATPMSPSRAAMITITSAIKTLPGHNGIRRGYSPKAIVCPVEQWATWKAIVGSEKAPEAGEFNQINVVYDMGLDVHPLPKWSNTTTNFGVLTDADNGFNFRWKRRPRNKAWVENSEEVMLYAISARWARGNSDPGRSFYFSNA